MMLVKYIFFIILKDSEAMRGHRCRLRLFHFFSFLLCPFMMDNNEGGLSSR